ncbi:DUF11 domain-containing protein, partial [Patescibacteria group bacterium]|nr:DUF11 domain-containing protein [Patescibacteria group bacterium]
IQSNEFTVSVGAYAKLQAILPGEIAAPGTASGVTGTSTPRKVGEAFLFTINAVDNWFNIISSVNGDQITGTSTDLNIVFNPLSGVLSNGTFSFTSTIFQTHGYQTITVIDTNNSFQATSSEVLVLDSNLALDHLTIAPTSISLVAGNTQQFAVTAYNIYNQAITGVDYIWAVTNPTAGSINQSGLFTASTAGTYPQVIKVVGTKNTASSTVYADVVVTSPPVSGGGGGGGIVYTYQLSLTKSASPSISTILMPGNIITYTLSYKNTGNAQLTEVTVKDTVPTGTTYVANSGGVLSDKIVTFNIGTLAADIAGSVSFHVKVNTPEEVNYVINKATIKSAQTVLQESNQLSHGVDPYTFTKTAKDLNGEQLLSGDIILYTLTITNIGVVPTTNIVITDNVPTNTTYVVGSITGTGANASNKNQLKWNVGSLSVNQSVDLTFKVTVNASLSEGVNISNQGSLTSDQLLTKSSSNVGTGGVTVIKIGKATTTEPVKPEPVKPEPVKPEPGGGFVEIKPVIKPEVVAPKETVVTPEPEVVALKDINKKPVLKAVFTPTQTTVQAVMKVAEAINEIRENPVVKAVNKKVITPIATSGAAVGVLPLLPYLGSLNVLQFFLLSFLSMFGVNKRKPWGVVYDSQTQKPIALAVVRMFDKNTFHLMETRVTDRKGRFGFLVQIGNYYITITKPNYVFPSQTVKGKVDGKYQDVYYGENISIQNKEDIIRINVPIDSIAKLKEEKGKGILSIAHYFLVKINTPLLITGIVLALVAAFITPNTHNALVVIIYSFLLYLKKLIIKEERKPWGKIFDIQTKKPLSLVIVQIYKKGYATPKETQITDHTGRFGFLPEQGEYYIVVEKEGYSPWKGENIKVGEEGFVAMDINLINKTNHLT